MMPKIRLHGGPAVADGMEMPVSRFAQGIVVYGTLYEPPPAPAPFYPDWYEVPWESASESGPVPTSTTQT